MNRLLIRSDHLSIRSDGHAESFAINSTQASSQPGARPATSREGVTRVANRDLQALWPAKLPRVDGPEHGPKRYLVISQPGGRPRRDYVPNAVCEQVVHLIDNFHRLREALNEICAINAELLRRRKDLG